MTIKEADIQAYQIHLLEQRRAPATIQKYLRCIRRFSAWLVDRPLSKGEIAAWANELTLSPVTANASISALNGFMAWMGRHDLHLRHNRVETPYFRPAERDLDKTEYDRLITTARRCGMHRIQYAAMTLAGLGIRVSELQFITVEALQRGSVSITNKGKTRNVIIPGKLRYKLLSYTKKYRIKSGAVFRTRTGRALSRGQIWAELKHLAHLAGVTLSKVFPHNLRHLFAVVYMKKRNDIFALCKLLGHSSVKTTQLYLRTSSNMLGRELDGLGFVL